MAELIDRQRRKKGQQGFTLIELLVVIIILGILAAVVVFAVGGVGDKGKAASYKIDERTIRTAQEVFRGQNGRYGTEAELVAAGLLSEQSSVHDIILADDQQSYVLPFAPQAGVPGGTLVVGETFAPPTNSSAGSALTWNPASDTSGSTHAYWEIMYGGLLTIDERGNPLPELATRVPTVANGDITQSGRVYRLLLRNNVFWHDSGKVTPTNPGGATRQFTADDVIYTFEKVLLRFHARTRNMGPLLNPAYDNATLTASAIAKCTVAELVNPGDDPNFCVAFHFTDPYAPLLKQLNVTEAAMTPRHIFCASGCAGANNPTLVQLVSNTVGTGPFMCPIPNSAPTPCRQGSDSLVVKNPTYWRSGFPYLDSIVMRDLSLNANTRTDALISGSVDWLWDVLETRATEVANNANLKALPTQSLGGGPNSIDQVIFNLWDQGATVAQIAATPSPTATPHPTLNHQGTVDPDGGGPEPTQPRGVLVRRALSHALNRPAYLATRGNVGSVATAPISSELSAFHANDINLPNFDLTAAGNLLTAAGWTDTGGPFRVWNGPVTPGLTVGTSTLDLSFVCQSATNCGRVDTIKSQLLLAKVNVVKLDCTTSALCGGMSANVRVFTNRDFDLFILNYAQGYDPHVGVRRQYHRDQITDASAGSVPNNAAGYRNDFVDDDFDNAVKTLDVGVRNSLYHDFQVRVAADPPYVWVIETPNVRGHTVLCSGLRAWTGQFAEFGSCRR